MKYIDAYDLAAIMKDEKMVPRKDYLVIDVRDDDRAGGHIIGSINEPSARFLLGVDQLVSRIKDVPLVIFHCALSQIRGPKAARIYEETREHMFKDNKTQPKQEIVILRNGFVGFQATFKKDPKLIEELDTEIWDPEEVVALSEDDDEDGNGDARVVSRTAGPSVPAPQSAPKTASDSVIAPTSKST